MRVFRGVFVFLVLAAPAMATPDPPPPAGFSGTQYIDGAGCVFQREGRGWQPRLDGRGQQICGFPPTMSYRSEAATDAPATSVEERLFEQLSTELRDGEFVADRRPAEPRDAPPPSGPGAIQRDIQARLANIAALKAEVSGGADSGLCALLGYSAGEPAGLRYDRDVTQGLCPGMSAAIPSARLGSVAVAAPVPVPVPAAAPKAAPKPVAAVPPKRPENAPAKPERVAKKPSTPAPEMIPAHARHIQVGAFQDSDSAMAAARRLAAAGHNVGRIYRRQNGQELQIITVGPFADRQALVRALARLRAGGFPRAQPR